MGKIKNIISKAALGIAAIVGTSAAIASSAKKKYKESKEAYVPNNGQAKTTASAQKTYTQRKNYDALREEKRKQREVQSKINDLSKTCLKVGTFGKLFFIYLLTILGIVIPVSIFGELFFSEVALTGLFVIALLLDTYIFILIRAGYFKSKLANTKETIDNLKYRLNELEKDKENKNDYLYADLGSEIFIYKSAIKNISDEYNKFIAKFPNIIYTKIFLIDEIDYEEKQEKITLTRTLK